jgi:DNA-binding GntR family transcriptional regulator
MAKTSAIPAAAPTSRSIAALSASLEPVSRETVQERVYRQLRQALIYGRFEPGQALTLHDLAASMQTSPMPVREALARLVSEQALETSSNRSVRVPAVDVRRLDDLLQARSAIEGVVLELAAPRLKPADFVSLRAANADYAKVAARRGRLSVDDALAANLEFHFLLYRGCGSPVLMPIIESLWLQSGALVRSAVEAYKPDGVISAFHFHNEIVDALECGDVARAKGALINDIGRSFSLVREKLVEEAAR